MAQSMKKDLDRMAREEKACRICNRSCNEPDPVNPARKLRWMYANQSKLDLGSNLVVVQGKCDHYCGKVAIVCAVHV